MRKVLLLLICSLLTGCASVYKPIPQVSYNQPTTLHINKPAALVWKSGPMTTQDGRVHFLATDGGALLFSSIGTLLIAHSAEQHAERGDWVYFGPQDQVIFMRSLRHYLVENKVFKKLQLTTKKGHDPNVIYITVKFKATRVGEARDDYPVTLDTVLTIENNKHRFTRHYFIHEQGKKPSGFDGNYFVYHTTKAAQRLLRDTVKGIIAWGKQYNKTKGHHS